MSIQNFNIFGVDIPVEDAEVKRLIGEEELVTEAQTIISAINEVYNLVTNLRNDFEDISTGGDIHSYNPATNTLTISKEG